jgi:hypothetical protein
VLELVVDGNPQALKDTGGWVNFVMSPWPARQGLGDGRDQIGGRPLGKLRPPRDNRTGDRSARTLFGESLKEVGQFGFAERREQFGRSRSLRGVKPHVERPVALNATLDSEAPSCVGQLVGREPQVEKGAVNPIDFEGIENLG